MNNSLCILIIADNPTGQTLLSTLLKEIRHWQISCVQCVSGKEALQQMCQQSPQVVFVDYQLAEGKGSAIIHHLKEAGCQAGFVLFTESKGEEALLEALHAGADDYLYKENISLETLSRALHHALQKSKTAKVLMKAMNALHAANTALEQQFKARTTQLQSTQNKLNIITSAAHDPIILLDDNAEVIFWNPAAENSFGYEQGEMMGHSFFTLLPNSDFKQRWINAYPAFPQTDQESITDHVSEFAAVRKNGDIFPVSASISSIQQPDGWHTVVIPRDITRRNKVEASLRQAKEEAEQAIQLKDQFVSLVAHDLRGPFTTILGFLELLENDKKNPLNKKQKGFLKWILSSSQKMVKMIDEILNISRLKTGKITPQSKFINARFLSSTIIDGIAPIAEKKGITLKNDISESCRLYADPDLYGEVLRNLLTNAVKFCRKEDTISLSCLENEPATIAVKDSGVGIAKKNLSKIFRIEEKTSTVGTSGEHGTGFGLPFSQELIKAHGGSLSVTSKEGKGSTFCVRLPDIIPQVLVVDDDELFRMLLTQKLRSERVTITEADNGRSALHLIEERQFHLIISDIQMPHMDGLELLKKLRDRPETKSSPIILVTSDDSISTREQAFQLGANDFITKPMDNLDFIPRIRRFLG